jgi:hypothetical protein
MSFLDLPETWTDRPLSDPTTAADVVDLLVNLGDRHRGTLTVVLCDTDDRYRATVCIDLPTEFELSAPTLSPVEICARVLQPITLAVRTVPDTALVLALGRPGPDIWPDLDNEWADAAKCACQAAQLRFLGFYVAAPDHVYQPKALSDAVA